MTNQIKELHDILDNLEGDIKAWENHCGFTLGREFNLFEYKKSQIDKIRAALKSMEWQCINTAPKDVGRVLVRDNGRIYEAYWNESAQSWKYLSQTGNSIRLFQLRHWKPLPTPPETNESEG